MVKVLFRTVVAAAGSLAIALLTFQFFHGNATIAAIFLLLGIVLVGAYGTRTEAIAASVSATVCLDYLFIPPIAKSRSPTPKVGLY